MTMIRVEMRTSTHIAETNRTLDIDIKKQNVVLPRIIAADHGFNGST